MAFRGNPLNPQWGREELGKFLVKNMKYTYDEIYNYETWRMRKLVTEFIEKKNKVRNAKKQLTLDI